MPPSLEKGPTAIVPIRTPKLLKSLLESWLEPGEDISKLTRKLWAEEVTRRAALRDPNQSRQPTDKKGD
jgi:hypothetical protein